METSYDILKEYDIDNNYIFVIDDAGYQGLAMIYPTNEPSIKIIQGPDDGSEDLIVTRSVFEKQYTVTTVVSEFGKTIFTNTYNLKVRLKEERNKLRLEQKLSMEYVTDFTNLKHSDKVLVKNKLGQIDLLTVDYIDNKNYIKFKEYTSVGMILSLDLYKNGTSYFRQIYLVK